MLNELSDTGSISTHAPHAGCDPQTGAEEAGEWISTHAPHAGCDAAGRADPERAHDFNSRTPRGMRLFLLACHNFPTEFQLTHPTRDATNIRIFMHIAQEFQLTHPTRDATCDAT